MREDIQILLQMIIDMNMGDDINNDELLEIAKRYNFDIEDSLIDLEDVE